MGLLEYRANSYSQNGEDGVLAEILNRLGLDDGSQRWCVEFGAWDGKYLSNTFLLVEKREWNAVYIEADPKKFRDLRKTAAKHPRIRAVNAMVGPSKSSGQTLDDLLAQTPLPQAYDLLSIDIDSFDLDVWVSHTGYRPKIVCIEIDSSIEPGILHW